MMGICRKTGIWDLDTAKKRHRFDKDLAEYIARAYYPKKIADVGCGNGSYCKFFKDSNWPIVHGYEGTPEITSLGIYDDIMTLDLTKRRYVDIDYDLVICLEVGEHIPEKYEQVVIDNICEFVTKDLILSWAVPGQGGAGHFNERGNNYIIREFVRRGLIFDMDRSNILRKVASLKWFKQTLLAFHRS